MPNPRYFLALGVYFISDFRIWVEEMPNRRLDPSKQK
jgi:hypothetical protein